MSWHDFCASNLKTFVADRSIIYGCHNMNGLGVMKRTYWIKIRLKNQ
jgi:hypothetical protein